MLLCTFIFRPIPGGAVSQIKTAETLLMNATKSPNLTEKGKPKGKKRPMEFLYKVMSNMVIRVAKFSFVY